MFSRSEGPLWRHEVKASVKLAWPLIATNIAQAVIHATDVVLLGWVGPRTLAAATLGLNLYIAFLVFGMGLVMAAAPMIAKEVGARSHSVRDVRRTVRQTMWAAIAITIPVWLILWHTEPILLFLGQEPALAADAQLFIRVLQWGLLPFLFYLILRSFISALEKPLWSLAVGSGAVLFNALVNYGLIFGKFGFPALGLLGAGIGSAAANFLMFAGMAVVVICHPRFRRYHLFGRFWRADWRRFREIWSLGLPIAITLGLEGTIFNAAVFLMGLIGAEAIAAHAIAIQIAGLSFMVPMGLGQAVTVRVGLAYGRRDREAVARAGWTSFALAIIFMTLMATILVSIPQGLVSIFLDPRDSANQDVISLAISFILVAAFFQIFDGAQVVGAGMLRGLHDTRIPMIYAALGYWVIGLGISVALGFGLNWGGVGIWVGLACGLAAVAILMITRWLRRERIGLIGW